MNDKELQWSQIRRHASSEPCMQLVARLHASSEPCLHLACAYSTAQGLTCMHASSEPCMHVVDHVVSDVYYFLYACSGKETCELRALLASVGCSLKCPTTHLHACELRALHACGGTCVIRWVLFSICICLLDIFHACSFMHRLCLDDLKTSCEELQSWEVALCHLRALWALWALHHSW